MTSLPQTSLPHQATHAEASSGAAADRDKGPSESERGDRVVVLPGVESRTTLVDEFTDQLPVEVIERVLAAARHALERSHQPATPEAVDRLARERLHARVAALVRQRR